jgi:hypothetical protein
VIVCLILLFLLNDCVEDNAELMMALAADFAEEGSVGAMGTSSSCDASSIRNRRDLGVSGEAFTNAMLTFDSSAVYISMGEDLEYFAGGLDESLSFSDVCLAYVINMKEKVNAKGTPRFKVGSIRSAVSVFKKIGQFCHNLRDFKLSAPQIEAYLKQWEKKEKEPKKAPALTESEVERMLWLPIGPENICMLVRNVMYCFMFVFFSLISINIFLSFIIIDFHRLVSYLLWDVRYVLPI